MSIFRKKDVKVREERRKELIRWAQYQIWANEELSRRSTFPSSIALYRRQAKTFQEIMGILKGEK